MIIEELLSNQTFTSKLDALGDDLDAISGLFKSYGVDVKADEIQDRLDKLDSDEFSEEDLDNVSGGLITPTLVLGGLLIASYLYKRLKKR